MLSIHKDLIIAIGEYLSNREKMMLSSICKNMNLLKCLFIYHDKVDVHTIEKLSYKQNFKHVIYVTASAPIPNYVTHLRLGNGFDDFIYESIPPSVISMEFNSVFNRSLDYF